MNPNHKLQATLPYRLSAQASRPLAHVVIAQVVPATMSMAVVFTTARLLGTEGRGQVAFMLVLISTLGAVLFLSLPVGSAVAVREGNLAGITVGGRLTLGVAGLIALLAAALRATGYEMGILSETQTFWSILAGSASVVNLYYSRTSQALKHSEWFRNGLVGQTILFGILSIGLTLVHREPISVLVGWYVSTLAGCIYFARHLARHYGTSHNLHKGIVKQVIGSSLAGHVGIMGQQVLLRADLILLGLLGTAASVGVYSVASPLAGLLLVISEGVALIANSASRTPPRSEALEQNSQLSRLNLTIGLACTPLILAGAMIASKLIPSFQGLVTLVILLVPGIIFQGASRISLATLQLLNLRGDLIFAGFVTGILSIAYVPSIIWWGAPGAATCSSIVYITQWGLLRTMLRRMARAERGQS